MTTTYGEVERLRARAEMAGEHVVLEMDEESFRAFYDRTARTLWRYLVRVTGERDAEDLLQETYYRFLRARGAYESESHRRNALFAIATNLARDRHRRQLLDPVAAASVPLEDAHAGAVVAAPGDATDLTRAMSRLKPRERGLLWLAYVQGWSHTEIAGALGLRAGSIKPLLYRARRRLASLLRGREERR